MTSPVAPTQAALTKLQQLTLPPLNNGGAIAGADGMPSQLMIRNWQQIITAIQGSINNLTDTVNNIEDVLNGTLPFSGLNASGQNVINFLANNTNGTAVSNPAGLSTNVVTTPAVAGGAITAPTSVDASPNYVINTSGVKYALPGCTITQTFNGGNIELQGRFTITHNQTSTALYTFFIDRTSSPAGASAYSDSMTVFIPGVASNYISFTLFFRDNNLGSTAGSATYTFSAEVNGSSGMSYAQTTSSVLLESRNYKR